jgi:hypothetical protein
MWIAIIIVGLFLWFLLGVVLIIDDMSNRMSGFPYKWWHYILCGPLGIWALIIEWQTKHSKVELQKWEDIHK